MSEQQRYSDEDDPNDPSPLLPILRNRILMEGPMPVADYMQMCLTHPDHGYYTTTRPIGGRASANRSGGDFITAPEVSQMFGEMIAVWCMEVWQALGCPAPFSLVEIGPGRGTLMRDFLRVARALPGFLEAADIHLVEISPTLGEQQSLTLSEHLSRIKWVRDIDQLPDQPIILIGNELLDALPFRQWVKMGDNWHERAIGLTPQPQTVHNGAATALHFTTRPNTLVPVPNYDAPDGTIIETAPAREGFVQALATRLVANQGAALLIDYGTLENGHAKPSNTFQAMRDHTFVDVLERPGEADLTSHVAFEPLVQVAKQAGCVVPPPTTQGAFLAALGIAERCGSLGQNKSSAVQAQLKSAVERLVLPSGSGAGEHPNGMGALFKVFAFGAPASLGERWPGFQ